MKTLLKQRLKRDVSVTFMAVPETNYYSINQKQYVIKTPLMKRFKRDVSVTFKAVPKTNYYSINQKQYIC